MMERAIEAGNIRRKQWSADQESHVHLYMGSGRYGACFDAYGLMNNGFHGKKKGIGNTFLMHADHFHRGDYGLDYWLPVARLAFASPPPADPTEYYQEQYLYDGRLCTQISWPELSLQLESYFHPERRDLFAVELTYESSSEDGMPPLLLAPELQLSIHYNQSLQGESETIVLNPAQSFWFCRIQAGNADSHLGLKVLSEAGTVRLESKKQGLQLHFTGKNGKHLLLIGTAGTERQSEMVDDLLSVHDRELYSKEAVEAWHRRWGKSYIELPNEEYQKLWARSLYYVLASYAPEVRSPAPPMGWSGNGWPFHFPQDLSYIHPALLRLGHWDIARSIVEFYLGYLENMKEYTKRVYGAEGVMWSWIFPIGPDSELLREGAPNHCHYEIHNAAYPARMAKETALYLKDPIWTKDIAWPIVHESARFFSSILKKEHNGTWGIHLQPSMGQDEMGGANAKNYLCSLYAAQYCLKTALEMAREIGILGEEQKRWETILRDGLSFRNLYNHLTGLYLTFEDQIKKEQLGQQKHPVQLIPLTFLPLGPHVEEPVLTAYSKRYELCKDASNPFFHGWTLADFWLAASHAGDSDGLLAELGQSLPSRYLDEEWIQIYETSGALHMPFYVTSHGLYLQAINDALLNDFWGDIRIGAACPDEWGEVSFTQFHTSDGLVRSGRKVNGRWNIQVVRTPE